MMKPVKHVFILGLDGAGNAPKDVPTPHLDRVLMDGAYTYQAQTAFPTISAECWGTMLLSVDPPVHGLTNDIVSSRPYPVDSPNPSIFRLAREQLGNGIELAAFSEWKPINTGIIEQNLDVSFGTGNSWEVVNRIADYLKNHNPSLLFMQLDGCDHAGHQFGYFTKGHYDAVEEADKQVGVVLDAIEKAGLWDDSLIIVTADHGGGGGAPRSHGADHPLDKTIFWGCRGPGIPKCEIKSLYVADTAYIAAKALGLSVPASWIGKIPSELA